MKECTTADKNAAAADRETAATPERKAMVLSDRSMRQGLSSFSDLSYGKAQVGRAAENSAAQQPGGPLGKIIRSRYKLLAAAIVLGGWWLLSLVYPPLVVPPISAVLGKIKELLSTPKMWKAIGDTVLRMLTGLGIGISIGSIAGLLSGTFRPFRETWRPIQGIVQVVPPISWLILAIIWLGYNGKASIFIVVMAVVPNMTICVTDGIDAIDRKLNEMCSVFGFSSAKRLRYLYVPSVLPHFFSGLRISIGTACKTVVMGEVLTTTTGIGGQITTARLNIEPETVIAWTVIVVGIYFVSVIIGKLLMRIWKLFRRSSVSRRR